MRVQRNIFVVSALSFLLVFLPVVCCCLTSVAQAHGGQASVVAKDRPCCDGQAKTKADSQLQHDSSKCECQNHIFAKAANIVPGGLEALFSQDQLIQLPGSISALVLSIDNPGEEFAFGAVHSPPRLSSNPLYIEFRTFRL
ncbi:MAG TPA: hypothetical protein P5160_02945 [Candidatus Omnitrophota bacterium]|nr:hypothetical protein [Candidatus Omnitrophota bacterium]